MIPRTDGRRRIAGRFYETTTFSAGLDSSSVHSLPPAASHTTPTKPQAMASMSIVEDEGNVPESSPRFNRLLTSVLGSPFVTTSDLPPSEHVFMRGYNTLVDLEQVDGALIAVDRTETVTRPPSPTPSFATDTFSLINWPESADRYASHPRPSISDAAPVCSFLPSGSRRSGPYPFYPNPAPTPFNSLRVSQSSGSKGSRNFNLLPRLWEVLRESSPAKKGKRRLDIAAGDFWNEIGGSGYIDWANLPPLDGEEGELIDDEACIIDVRAVTGLGKFLTLRALDPVGHNAQELDFNHDPNVAMLTRLLDRWSRTAPITPCLRGYIYQTTPCPTHSIIPSCLDV